MNIVSKFGKEVSHGPCN